MGEKTRFASLEIGCERSGLAGDCDSGYSCAYSSNVAWKSATQPVAKETNPRLVFERLFGNGDAAEQGESMARRRLLKQSILDFVSEDAGRLKSTLGGNATCASWTSTSPPCARSRRGWRSSRRPRRRAWRPACGSPTAFPTEYGEHLRLMGDMMILAFQADLTRVCTFMFANDGSNRSYAQAGVPEGPPRHEPPRRRPDQAREEGEDRPTSTSSSSPTC